MLPLKTPVPAVLHQAQLLLSKMIHSSPYFKRKMMPSRKKKKEKSHAWPGLSKNSSFKHKKADTSIDYKVQKQIKNIYNLRKKRKKQEKIYCIFKLKATQYSFAASRRSAIKYYQNHDGFKKIVVEQFHFQVLHEILIRQGSTYTYHTTWTVRNKHEKLQGKC